MNEETIEGCRKRIAESDAVLIGAGAGLSAAAGLNYTDKEAFARIFPAWKKRGFSMQYEFVGYQNWSPLEMWGYLTVNLEYVYYGQRENSVYQALRELIGLRNYFVITSNVDDLFHKNGFDTSRIFTPQGSYGKIQCTTPCVEKIWDMRPYFDTLQKALDPETQCIIDPQAIPACPNCGGNMFLNVRVDNNMVDSPYLPQHERFNKWLDSLENEKLLILDLGSGYSTPGVVRIPVERVASLMPESHLIRVNPMDSQVPPELHSRSFSFDVGVREFLDYVAD